MTDRLPVGWFDLVADLRLTLMREYPTVRVRSMTSDRGWLHVNVDDTHLDPGTRLQLSRVVQGYVTQSLHVCAGCGSAHARDRGQGRLVTCNKCETECCDA